MNFEESGASSKSRGHDFDDKPKGNERLGRYSRRIGGDISPCGAQYLLGGGGGPRSEVTARMMDASEITF